MGARSGGTSSSTIFHSPGFPLPFTVLRKSPGSLSSGYMPKSNFFSAATPTKAQSNKNEQKRTFISWRGYQNKVARQVIVVDGRPLDSKRPQMRARWINGLAGCFRVQ